MKTDPPYPVEGNEVRAFAAIWHDIAPEGLDNFYEWHDRNHAAERVSIPGFIRGRRFVADSQPGAFFTLYETESLDAVTGREYMRRLNSPTEWTRLSLRHARNNIRAVGSIERVQVAALGAYMVPMWWQGEEAARWAGQCDEAFLKAVFALPQMTGARLGRTDLAASGAQAGTSEKRGAGVIIPGLVLFLEGCSAAAVAAAAGAVLARLPGECAAQANHRVYRQELGLDRAHFAWPAAVPPS